MINVSLLAGCLAELGWTGTEAERLQGGLCAYLEAIEAMNPAWGLVGASGDELIIKHIIDSLAPIAILDDCLARLAAAGQMAPRLADLGSGAGLPGIPLALARPGLPVTLVDRMTRRINFLQQMQSKLGLSNVDILEQQVEHARGQWDILTFRAFRPFERKLFKKVFGLCRPGGYVLAYKGRRDRAEAELAAIDGLYHSAEILDLRVPQLSDQRCVVRLRARS